MMEEAMPKLRRRRALLAIFYLLLAVFLSGCAVARRLPLPLPGRRPGKPREVTLKYWGLWEPEAVMRPLIEAYQKDHPNIKIEYRMEAPGGYRERVQARLRGGEEVEKPDIFRFHNTWLPMLKNDLVPLPQTIMTNAEFEKTFYPVTKTDLKIGGSYYGIPLEFDGLALFYNEDLFARAGLVSPPTIWDELRDMASKLAVRDETGKLVIAGVALGTAENVDHFSDILALMMLQNGADLSNMTGELAEDALDFYTIFTREDKVWEESPDFPSSTVAFANGKVAMMFGPSWRVFNIKDINPDLRFKVAPVPQLPGEEINWASYWVEGVAKNSQFQAEAWDFLKFLSSKDSLRRFYSEASKQRLFGEPYSRRDMAESLVNEEYVGPFIAAAPTARSWYAASRTFDKGINDKIIKYLKDAINARNRGSSAASALQTATQGISQVLSQYQVATSRSAATGPVVAWSAAFDD